MEWNGIPIFFFPRLSHSGYLCEFMVATVPHWLFMGVYLYRHGHMVAPGPEEMNFTTKNYSGQSEKQQKSFNKQHGLRLLVVRVGLGRMFFFPLLWVLCSSLCLPPLVVKPVRPLGVQRGLDRWDAETREGQRTTGRARTSKQGWHSSCSQEMPRRVSALGAAL